MRLLKLYSNKDSFQTVTFNREGISIILGKMSHKTSINRKETYNGVGKSLVISLIHFCLGANQKKGITEALKSWEFFLDFEIGNKFFTVKRSIDDPSKVIVNSKTYSLENYKNLLEPILFDLGDLKIDYLKYRSLICRFIRPYRASYDDYDKAVPKELEYARQLCNAFLLGLDPVFADKKYHLKKDLDDSRKFSENISKDSVLKQFFQEGKKVEFEVVNLRQKINQLENKIKNFIVSEDFDKLKKEADDFSAQLKSMRNKRTLIENTLKSINKSLEIQPDLTTNDIVAFYKDAKVELGNLIIKEIQDIETFNQKLIYDRRKRLEEEKRSFLIELETLKNNISRSGKLEDEKLRLLDTTGALEDYKALNDELSNMRFRLEKLETYTKLMDEYEIKQSEIKKELEQENTETLNYLQKQKNLIDGNILTFQSFAQKFYEKKRAGIEISNDDGKNQLRYHIRAEIQNDASDGINQVKLFCFDYTILKNQHNHHINFLFHDGRILDAIDPRQRAILFRIAFEECVSNHNQYIISANEDILDSMKAFMDEQEFKDIVEKNIVLELTDKSDASKLLGVQIDFNYEND